MKNRFTLILCALLCALFCGAQKLPDYNPNDRWVTDLGGIFTPDQKAQLSQILSDYEKETSVEIAILTVCDFESSIEDFSQKTAEKWGVGKKGVNNGILITISKCKLDQKQRGFRVEIGYGLEGYLPDGWVKPTQDSIRGGFYYKNLYFDGTVNLLQMITTKIGNEYSQDKNTQLIKQSKKKTDDIGWAISLLKKIPWFVWPIIIGAWVVLFFISPELAMDILWILFWILTLGRAGGGGGSFGGGKFGGGGSSD